MLAAGSCACLAPSRVLAAKSRRAWLPRGRGCQAPPPRELAYGSCACLALPRVLAAGSRRAWPPRAARAGCREPPRLLAVGRLACSQSGAVFTSAAAPARRRHLRLPAVGICAWAPSAASRARNPAPRLLAISPRIYREDGEKRWDIEVDGKVMKDMDRTVAFTRALKTLAGWVDVNLLQTNTQVFFQGISPSHYK
ncbi:hypothetical protein ACQ4PT_037505 [Festuca glaucescens]